METYRIEHRTQDGATAVVGTTSTPAAGQMELSARAVRMIAEGATGELVLVSEATNEEVARRYLAAGADVMTDGAVDAAE